MRKFCVVRGAWPSYNAKVMRPSGRPPMLMSIQQVERAIVLLACYLAAVSRFFAAQAFRIMLPSRAVRGGRRRRAGAALSLQAVLRLQRLEGRPSSAISKVKRTGPARRTAASARDLRCGPRTPVKPARNAKQFPPLCDGYQARRTVGPLARGFALETWRCGLACAQRCLCAAE